MRYHPKRCSPITRKGVRTEENICSMHDKIKAGSLTISDGTFPAAAVQSLAARKHRGSFAAAWHAAAWP